MSQSRLYLTARKPEASHIARLLDPGFEDDGITSALFEDKTNPDFWCYSIYVPSSEAGHWRNIISDRLGHDNFGLDIGEEIIEETDWVSQTLRDLKPVRAGRFLVHGSHDRTDAAKAPIAVEIDAGQAFGTGHHGTTAGCLDMLERCLRKGTPGLAFDIGTGTGVLAIALAKAAKIPVLATDIDPVSTCIAAANAKSNGVAPFVHCETVTGFQNPIFAQSGPADLIFANILARPLEALARPMAPRAAHGADIILSGLLPHQRARIIAAYARQGFVFRHAHIRDGWLTLLLRKP